mmetsp:Transcript_38823/g.125514  ORF Transcript_38823/g.125514 Transcript_38823/m.125514 type:complete len:85 (+) Transcript_38823:137-391(+)
MLLLLSLSSHQPSRAAPPRRLPPPRLAAPPPTPNKMSDWRRVLAAGDVPAELLPATDAEWKSVLEPMAYAVLREEAPSPSGPRR